MFAYNIITTMKKLTLLCTVIAVLGLAACEKKAEKTTETPIETTTPAETPEAGTPAPATPGTPAAKTNPDGTTIDVGNDGVSVGTKKGDNETNVKVSKDSARIQIKMPR